jgi:hypothetical protein
MAGFIKYNRTEQTDNLHANMAANHLLTVIAFRASRYGNPVKGVKVGEAQIGDYEKIGMSRSQYRTALDNLVKWGYVLIRPTNNGTFAKLANNEVFDINYNDDSQQIASKSPTDSQQVAIESPTDSHYLRKKEYKEEEELKEEEEESKKENTPSLEVESLISDFEKLKSDYSNLQTELKKEKEKSCAKKEKAEIDEGLTYPKNFTEELKQAFRDFIQMRKDIRKPFKLLKSKQTKLDSLGKDIANFGEENVLGAILRSTENEYQGIFVKDFADKHKKSNNGKQTNNNKQPIDDGLSYAERAMRERFGSDLLTDQYQNGSSDDNYQGVEQEF